MNKQPGISRRRFLCDASMATGVIVAHCTQSSGSAIPSTTPVSPANPRIARLELQTAATSQAMRDFYHGKLGLAVISETPTAVTFAAGESRLTFLSMGEVRDKPFYHFAFNIPENKLLSARSWQLQRTPLMPIPERLRDPLFPDDVVNYSHWNAHSLFFYDPGGNVVEYIARHDLRNASKGEFTSKDILYASEIGLIVDDVPSVAETLKGVAGVGQYRGGSDAFMAMGDEHGLLLVMKRGRILNFSDSDSSKAARVYRTGVAIHGGAKNGYAITGFPYHLSAAD